MSRCVPTCDLDDNSTLTPLALRPRSNSSSVAHDASISRLDYEVAELTWENGQLAMHGLGPPRTPCKPPQTPSCPSKYDCVGGTLESIVNQATCFPNLQQPFSDNLVPWYDHHRAVVTASRRMAMDALVPCSKKVDDHTAAHVSEIGGAQVGSCSMTAPKDKGAPAAAGKKRSTAACVPVIGEVSSIDLSMSSSATFSRFMTADTDPRELGVRTYTSTSMESLENTSTGKPFSKATTTDEHDSVCHSRPVVRNRKKKEIIDEDGGKNSKKKRSGKSCVSTKRSRAADIHNLSERKRRDKINQKMKTLQKLVPSSCKADKASILDEVIEYLKQLQAQIQMMNRMNMQPMMLPLAMQQQLQMSMMAQMGMGMSMGMGMGMNVVDNNNMARAHHHNLPAMSPVLHPAFMPLASWDNSSDRMMPQAAAMTDPLASFFASQSQPAVTAMDAYNKMVALYQQMHQSPISNSKG